MFSFAGLYGHVPVDCLTDGLALALFSRCAMMCYEVEASVSPVNGTSQKLVLSLGLMCIEVVIVGVSKVSRRSQAVLK